MSTSQERRGQDRLQFLWPLWFCYEEYGELQRGQIIDFNGSHVSFRIPEHQCPPAGHHLMIRFSYPINEADRYDIGSYVHWGEVIRVDDSIPNHRRVALRLHRPVHWEPVSLTANEDRIAQPA